MQPVRRLLPFLSLPLLAGLIAPALTPTPAYARELGSHHMVTLAWAGGAASYQNLFDQEAANWKAAGLDFVILHMDGYNGAYPAQLRAYYDACAKVGIKASASWAWFSRVAAEGDPGGTWIPQIVRDTKDHPAQWKIDGVPVYSAFNLPSYTKSVLEAAGLWPVKIWAHSYYYALTGGQLHWTSDANVIRKTYDTLPWLEGLCNFSGDMSASQIASLNRLLLDVGTERGKRAMGGVTPFYGSHHLWDMGGFRGLETQWRAILQQPPEAVWWVTSNDWRELSYVMDLPDAPVWSDHWNRADMPPLLDHSGYRKFAEPFVTAYKSGAAQPTFSRDRLFLAYQLHPKGATPVAGSSAHVFGGRIWREALPDRIFAAAHLTAPARLRINGVLSEEFPAGIAHFDLPLAMGAEPEVAIVRSGTAVIGGHGPLPITDSVLTGAWNYLVVEIESEPGPVPGEPPLASSRRPYQDTRATIPGRVEAEAFDEGGADVAYFDTTTANQGGSLRTEAVDLEQGSSGIHIAWFAPTEWMLYSVQCQQTGRYRVDMRVACNGPGGKLQIELDGTDISGPLVIPDTSGWDKWATVSFETILTAGEHDLKLVGVEGGAATYGQHVGNVDWMTFTTVGPTMPAGDGVPTPSLPQPASTSDGRALAWKPAPGATRYEVWRSPSAEPAFATMVGATSASSLVDPSSDTGATPTYWVLAFRVDDTLVEMSSVTVSSQPEGSRLTNLSSRGRVLPEAPLASGFVLRGQSTRKVLVRAIGPGLEAFGVPGGLRAPIARITDVGVSQTLSVADAGWGTSPNAAEVVAAVERTGAFALDAAGRDAALVLPFSTGVYTAEITSGEGTPGVCLLELYAVNDSSAADSADLLNLSTRAHAATGADTLICGFVVEGDSAKQVLIRGAGPALATLGVADAMNDPQIRVLSGDFAIAANSDWLSEPSLVEAFERVGAFPFAEGGRDAAVVVTLPPGPYTVLLEPADGRAGVALLEIYDLTPAT